MHFLLRFLSVKEKPLVIALQMNLFNWIYIIVDNLLQLMLIWHIGISAKHYYQYQYQYI